MKPEDRWHCVLCSYLVRNIGANNPATGVDPDEASFNGPGNAYPLVGTGKTFYVQAGFLFPPMGKGGRPGTAAALCRHSIV
jgi:hypothetical protein